MKTVNNCILNNFIYYIIYRLLDLFILRLSFIALQFLSFISMICIFLFVIILFCAICSWAGTVVERKIGSGTARLQWHMLSLFYSQMSRSANDTERIAIIGVESRPINIFATTENSSKIYILDHILSLVLLYNIFNNIL